MDIDDIKCEEKVKTVNILEQNTRLNTRKKRMTQNWQMALTVTVIHRLSCWLSVILNRMNNAKKTFRHTACRCCGMKSSMHSCMNQGWMPTAAAFKAVGQPMKK